MTIRIDISNQALERLKARAAAAGEDQEKVAARLLEDAVLRPTLDEVLAPVRAEFESSGMDEDTLGDLLERAKHDLRAERRTRKAS